MRNLAKLFLPLLLLSLAPKALAITVTTLVDENDSPAGAQVSLREAIRDTASGGPAIDFVSGLSGGTIKLQHGSLVIGDKSVTIDGSALPGGVSVCGKDISAPVFFINTNFGLGPKSVDLRGLAIVNGNSQAAGGGILAEALVDSPIALTLTDCHIAHNKAATVGGGISFGVGVSCTMNRCSICWNSANTIGGIYAIGALNATNCTIACNRSLTDDSVILTF